MGVAGSLTYGAEYRRFQILGASPAVNETLVTVAVPALCEPLRAAGAPEWRGLLVHAPHVVLAVPLEPKARTAVRAGEWPTALVHSRDMCAQVSAREERRPAHVARERTHAPVRGASVPTQ